MVDWMRFRVAVPGKASWAQAGSAVAVLTSSPAAGRGRARGGGT